MDFVKSGFGVLDREIGGLSSKKINMVYGEAATGKTTLCLIFCAEMLKKGKKVLFLDSENGFSVERLKQVSDVDIMKNIDNILVIKISSFDEQRNKINMLHDIVERGNFDVIILDTIGYHYRKALKTAPYRINKDADIQFRILKDLVDNGKIVLITNQVYANFKEKDKVEMVGGKMFRNWSGMLVEIIKKEDKVRVMEIIKPKEKIKKFFFKIVERGFIPL
jgi:DNA repair protein RadB